MRQLPTGTVTLLFTDIEGSTRLLQQLGERYASILAECRRLLRAAFQQWHGYEVDTQGDALLVILTIAQDLGLRERGSLPLLERLKEVILSRRVRLLSRAWRSSKKEDRDMEWPYRPPL
jgi:class 3 adenylate cyclase